MKTQALEEILTFERTGDVASAIDACSTLLRSNPYASNLWSLLGRLRQRASADYSNETHEALRTAYDLTNIADKGSIDALAELFFYENIHGEPKDAEILLTSLIYRIGELRNYIAEATE